jgi:hypothetical protein
VEEARNIMAFITGEADATSADEPPPSREAAGA